MMKTTRMTNTPPATPAAIMSHGLLNSSLSSLPSLVGAVGGSSVSVTSMKLHYSYFLIIIAKWLHTYVCDQIWKRYPFDTQQYFMKYSFNVE